MASASGIASGNSLLAAIRAAFDKASQQLRATADFAILFISGDGLAERAEDVLSLWQDIAPGVPLFGGSAESLVGQQLEVEGKTAASLLLVSGMNSPPKFYELECIQTPDGPSVMGVSESLVEESRSGLMVLACPVSFSIELLADVLEYEKARPNEPVSPLLGGYCSSQNWQSPSVLFCGDHAVHRGAVALSLPKGWSWHTIISQGCRPIGDSFVITRMEGQTICELGGKPAMEQLRELYSKLPASEQQMMSSSLMVGRAIDEYRASFSYGDFLIRAVQGIDSSNQGLVVTDRFQVGQTVRFHVRDAQAATSDLAALLSKYKGSDELRETGNAEAGVLFTCNGRGTRMFATQSHDAQMVDHYFPELPLAGIFAAGEFGPIANVNVVHGFTAILHLLMNHTSESETGTESC